MLEWTGAIVPQGMLVKTAKLGWRTAWQVSGVGLAAWAVEGTASCTRRRQEC